MIIVTSFNQAGFDQYGKRMLHSVKLNTPFQVVVYTDGFDLPKSDRITAINQKDVTPELYHFRKRFEPRAKPGAYSYRWDAGKFAGKSYAIIHAMKTLEKFMWFDGDTLFMQKPNPEFFDFCHDYFSCYLGRDGKGKNPQGALGAHTETGFLSFDMTCDGSTDFSDMFQKFYDQDLIYNEKEWHDCIAYDEARKKSNRLKFKNLTPDAPPGSHAFVEFFHPYVDHCKGPNRKKMGYSPEFRAKK